MSTEEERELRAELRHAEMYRGSLRFYEFAAVFVGVLLPFLAIVCATWDPSIRHLLLGFGTFAWIAAAFYNLYARVLMQPRISQLQETLNKLIERS